MRRDISEMKQAVESTNASLKLAVERLDTASAAITSTNAELNVTNARLNNTNAAVENMNARLNNTNSKLDRTMITVAKLVGSMVDMKQYLSDNMATKKDMSDLNGRMDGFSGLLLDSRHRWAIHAETLTKYDDRLKKLETPTA